MSADVRLADLVGKNGGVIQEKAVAFKIVDITLNYIRRTKIQTSQQP
jgi:hypothetical protein